MATIKAILRKKDGDYRVNSEGEAVIYIQYGHKGKTVLFTTGHKIKPEHWQGETDHNNLIKRSFGTGYSNKSKAIKKKLQEIENIQTSLELQGIEPTVDRVKSKYEGDAEAKEFKQKDIVQLFDDFISEREASKATNTIKNYKVCKMHLQNFSDTRKDRLTLDKVNVKMVEEFRGYLSTKGKVTVKDSKTIREGLINNTVEGIIKSFKAFLARLKSHGHQLNINPTDIKVKWEDPQIIFLTQTELKKLYEHEYKPKQRNLEAVRDLFVFGCCTGFRYSDLSRLRKDHIIDGNIIKMKAYKTKTATFVPLIPRAKEILKKYNNRLPRYAEPVFNRLVKNACKEAGIDKKIELFEFKGGGKKSEWIEKWKIMSSHKAVSTFITHALENGVPAKHVAHITGKTIKVINRHYAGVDEDNLMDKMLKAFA